MSWSRVPPKSKGLADVVVEVEAVPESFLVAVGDLASIEYRRRPEHVECIGGPFVSLLG